MSSHSAKKSGVLLEARALTKHYTILRRPIVVLKGASFVLHEGETLAVVGASGAGKSTLLHVLGGLDAPDAGEVRLGGVSLYGESERRRTQMRATDIGFVFQSYHLLPEMDVLENVLLPARALRLQDHGRVAHRRALELLDAVGLKARMTHRPMELSGGEQQRVALARAMMNRPRLLLADEPTGNLDATTGGLILDCLFSLSRESGHGLVIVTHSADTAARCDRTLRLTDGVLV